MSGENEELIIHKYDNGEVTEYENTQVPKFLKITYVIVAVVGAIGMYFFWNGSAGYFDRGYWQELQVLAGTTRDSHGHEVIRPTE